LQSFFFSCPNSLMQIFFQKSETKVSCLKRIFLHLSNWRWSAHAEAQRSMALFPACKCSEKRPRDASSINRPRYLFLFALAADKLILRRNNLKWKRFFIFSFDYFWDWLVCVFHFWNEKVFSFLHCHFVPRSVVRFCRSLNDKLIWLSEAKLKTRSEASRQIISNIEIQREATLRDFCFARSAIFTSL